MDITLWLAFVAASAALLAIPGPTVLLVVAYAIGAGRGAALWTVLGVFLGDLLAITLAVLGLGALLTALPDLFFVLKLCGGIYLIWLGWKLITAPVAGEAVTGRRAATPGPAMAFHAFAVTATNPKSIVFFVAFLPQFMDASAPALPQFTVIVATFTALAALNALLYALAAGTMRERLKSPRILRWMNRAGGGALITMGALTAALRSP